MRFYLFICLLLLAAGCFTPKEACLEIEAANFDASADENCCCVYPKIGFTFSHVYDTLVFFEKTAYRNDFGMFRPHSVVFYLQNFQLRQQGAWYPITDTLSMASFGANAGDTTQQVLTNDFILLRRTSLQTDAGTFRKTGTFDGIQFDLGLSDAANKVVPSKAPTAHPLRTQADNLWIDRNTGYVFARIIVASDSLSSTVPDTFVYTVNTLPNTLFQQLGTNLDHATGYDFDLKLKIDYKQLFNGVDWSAPLANRKVTMGDNLLKVFTVSQ